MSNASDWALVCHTDYGERGEVAMIRPNGGQFDVTRIPAGAATGEQPGQQPYFFGINAAGKSYVMDAASKAVSEMDSLPADVFPAYSYRDDEHQRIWFMFDGDKDGNDPLNCGDNGSSVTIVKRDTGAEVINTLCVGRGHHVTLFVGPTEQHPGIPKRAFVSNLLDGSICIVGNDENDPDSYLQIIDTINLCEAGKEDSGEVCLPNNAFPHGMVFSPVTGKIYNLNNGYASIAVIDPIGGKVEQLIPLKGCSNLLNSPCGRFLIGKGANRKADPEHVIGKLVVIDAQTGEQQVSLDIPDYYPSVYRFTPDGKKLYLTSATTGKGAQRDNLVNTTVQVYDTSKLPEIRLLKTIEVGKAECGRRPIAFAHQGEQISHVFIPNPTDGSMSILDADDNLLATVDMAEPNARELLFSFWGDGIYGA